MPKRADAPQDVGLLEKACIASYKGKIIFLGKEKKFKKELTLLLFNLLFIRSWGQALLLERKTHQPLIFQASF